MMKESSPHCALMETPAVSPPVPSIPRELAGILGGLLSRSRDPLDDEIIELAKTLENACAKMEALAREMRALGALAGRLIEERSRAEEPVRSRAIVEPKGDEPGISARERQVLTHLLGGMSNREISRELGISEKTVKNHLWKVYRKIGVKSRTQLFHQLIST